MNPGITGSIVTDFQSFDFECFIADHTGKSAQGHDGYGAGITGCSQIDDGSGSAVTF
jgi:hypothetical protein